VSKPGNVVFQTTTFIPQHLLPRERAQEIFDMLDAGLPMDEIYDDQRQYMKTLWNGHNSRPSRDHAKQRVNTLLLNKWRYCPDLDEIAIERAFDGDREVWIALTHYERQEVIDRLYELWHACKRHRKWPDDECSGIGPWARSVGESPRRITGIRKGPDGIRRRIY
jgi:hypothetical protein